LLYFVSQFLDYKTHLLRTIRILYLFDEDQ
jgi:hypothetical protein